MTNTTSSTDASTVAEQPMSENPSNGSEQEGSSGLPENTESNPEGELEVLLEDAATILSENGFAVSDTDVQWFSDELWGFIWLSGKRGKPRDSRQEAAKQLLESHVETADTDLPTSVNMSCGTAGDSAVAVWI
jgi:hypothetical protein